MTEYEIADYTSSVMGNFLSALTIYFSIATTYVIAAFSAGKRLSSFQVAVVNVGFTIAAGIMGMLSVLIFDRFFQLAIRNQGAAETDASLVDFTYPLALLVLIIYVGCLAFMWTIRTEQDDV
jgi:hypothetical protein